MTCIGYLKFGWKKRMRRAACDPPVRHTAPGLKERAHYAVLRFG